MILAAAAVATIYCVYLILLSVRTCAAAMDASQGLTCFAVMPGSERQRIEPERFAGPWPYGACTELSPPTLEWGYAIEAALSSGSARRVFEMESHEAVPVGCLVQVQCGDAVVLGEVVGSRRCDSGIQVLVRAEQFIRGNSLGIPDDIRARAAKGSGRCLL